MNISLNLKKRDFKKELDDIETKLKELEKQKADHLEKIAAFR
jgi:hypothetical protein